MWQVSISTDAAGESAATDLLERLVSSPSVFSNALTGSVVVTAYPKRLPPRLHATLADALKTASGKPRIVIKPLPRRNWAESWKRHFKAIEVGTRLLVKPGWIKTRPRPGQRVVILDPGLSFGTGNHPTTLFCLQRIAQFRRPETAQSFLDVGTGSGILAIAAAKLGYAPVLAFDNDPEAVRTATKNVKKNRVQPRVVLRRGDLNRWPLRARRRYDLVCANVTADLLLRHAKKIRNLVRPGGRLVVAGILAREFPEVSESLHRINLTLETSKVMSNWKSGQFRPRK
jgi:ribosomal protein L11 methyltransferase